MCRTYQHINNSFSFNWDGDIIEQNTVIQKCRKVTGTKIPYDVDIREFLTSTDNKIIKTTLEDIYKKLQSVHKKKFISRKEGSFDFRVDVIKEFISQNITYQSLSRECDNWLFPEETLTLKGGDCEDRAFLMASLMLASGLSKYVVRVAFGEISDITGKNKYDHVWIMYKNEKGVWQLIEPMNYRPHSEEMELAKNEEDSASKSYIYRPYYVMNSDHLWSVYSRDTAGNFGDYIKNRKNWWQDFYPTFGYKVHKEIITSAIDADDFKTFLKENNLQNQVLTLGLFNIIPSKICLGQFAYQVSNVDISLVYEPWLHFDNALIKESFALMEDNMKAKTLNGLARVFHAIGDIYAHTSYPSFAKMGNNTGALEIFEIDDPDDPDYQKQFNILPDYSAGIFNLKNFSTNDQLYQFKDKKARAIAHWKNKIISGRFGQSKDSQGILERTQFWPKELKENSMQGALPHHNEIAVDGPVFDPKKHKLYNAESEYRTSYELRKKTAIRHISKKFQEWKSLF